MSVKVSSKKFSRPTYRIKRKWQIIILQTITLKIRICLASIRVSRTGLNSASLEQLLTFLQPSPPHPVIIVRIR